MKPITKKLIFCSLAVLVVLIMCVSGVVADDTKTTANKDTVKKHSIFYQFNRLYYEVKDIPVGEVVEISKYKPQGYNVSKWTSNDVVIENDSFVMPDKNVTLNANVTPKTYNVTFVTNGGSIVGSYNASRHYGETYILPKFVNKDKDTFLGWYDNPNFTGSKVIQINPTEEGDRTYYAKFQSDVKDSNTSTGKNNNNTTSNSSTQKTTKSPFPIIGVLAGLGIAGFIIARKRR